MRDVDVSVIEKEVKDLCIKANTVLRNDMLKAIKNAYDQETEEKAREMLGILLENAEIAEKEMLPICQDTGMVAIFLEIGKDVAIKGGNLNDAINRGVSEAYAEGCFRNSVVEDPIKRKNTGNNTPAVLHTEIVDGEKIEISVIPKGFGAENKSKMAMLNPTAGKKEIVDFCVETVKTAGPDACPPYVMGIGLGGTMEMSAYLAKKALLRSIDEANPKEHIAELEKEIKDKCNALNIGVMGLGGGATVLGVGILEAPTHIAGLPITINICCHALRSASRKL